MACARACSPGGSCCSTSGGAGCPSDPSLPSPTAHSVSGKPLRRSGPRRAASAVGCRQCPQQTAEEPAAQGQTRPSGDLDGRDQKGGAGRLRRLCRDLRDQVRQGGRVPRKGPRRTARLLRFSRRALEALTDHEPNREHVRDDPPSHGALEGLPVEQDRARPDFQAGPGRREELATARWSPPLAEGDPRGHLHRWRRGRQPTSSSRCRLTPTVTNIRRYLLTAAGQVVCLSNLRDALMKPLQPSKELAAVVGSKPLPRPEVVSKIWDYIKRNKLQNPQNKREIRADDKLRPVFGKDSVSMFEMNKHLAQHLK